jgi:hypothetical protein
MNDECAAPEVGPIETELEGTALLAARSATLAACVVAMGGLCPRQRGTDARDWCTFDDDIQGTAAVAAGTLLAAMKVTGQPITEQRIVIVGAGSAGCGIANLLLRVIVDAGLPEPEPWRCRPAQKDSAPHSMARHSTG